MPTGEAVRLYGGRYILRPVSETENGQYQYTIYARQGHKMLDSDPAETKEQAMSNAQQLVSVLEKARQL
ncbi:MAG: hypothetical protein DWQ07_25525 [Chloroflexi bacterium]|nr:MAG: hypothetical protein DWQ07_25525 [Chloroflexota bacterium]MBL1197178.1 hypothetical protein [Chloroflexota bacterium]NOH14473.1 hypothetical protein [Chloroflexota bacterium]